MSALPASAFPADQRPSSLGPVPSAVGLSVGLRPASAAVLPARRQFSVDDYYRMAEAGVLGPDDRVELLRGEIVMMSPIGSRHAACVRRLHSALAAVLADRAMISVQSPVRLDAQSEPEPDVAVLTTRPDWYASAHPTPADVLLLIEVCDTSWDLDSAVKRPLYAASGIAEVWLINLAGAYIEASWDPAAEGYGAMRRHRAGDTIAPQAFGDLNLAVADLLV
ncbi:MAG: Uma2 family endonuclease [Acidimicrobiales bacterium]